MGLETITNGYISELNASNPASDDNMHEGDNHIRNIKNCLLTTFPAITGVVTASHTELNYVYGVTDSIQTQLDGKEDAFASGTKMVFYQESAPTGWTQVSVDNAMLRVVDGVTTTWVTGVQGSDSPILMDKVPSHTHSVSGTTGGGGSHYHIQHPNTLYSTTGAGSFTTGGSGGVGVGTQTESVGDHTHSFSATTGANGSASNWTPKYINVIVASKD